MHNYSKFGRELHDIDDIIYDDIYCSVPGKHPLRVSAHVTNFKGSLLQLPYKHMEFILYPG